MLMMLLESNVSSDVGHGGISFFGDVINVFVPREV